MYIDPDHRTGYHRSSFIVFIMAFILAFSGEDAMSGVQSDFYGHIVIGGDKNYPPFEYLDDGGRPAGFIVDISRAIGREVGLEIFFRLGTWAQVVDELESGRVDVLQGMFYSPERDLKYDFTQAHSVNNYVMVVRNGERKIPTSLAELADLHIVVQKSDIMHDFALKNKLGRPLSVEESPERALRELAGGRYDCALMARIPTLYLIRKNGWTDFVLGKKPILTTQYCYAVANNNRALLAQFSEGLKIIEENGEYRRIYEKWLGTYQAPYPDFLTIVGYVSMAAVPLILLALLFFLWSWSLRKQVANRTLALAGDVAHQIELLITDVVMPDMNGRDLAGEFLAMNADLKILFMSGYTANVIGHRGVLDEGVNFIAKPFSQKELGIKVREILDN